MRRFGIWGAVLFCTVGVTAIAQTPVTEFNVWLNSRTPASTTLGSTDIMPVVQGGETRKLYPQSFFMRPDGSNATPISTNRVMGNVSGTSAVPTALTSAQGRTALGVSSYVSAEQFGCVGDGATDNTVCITAIAALTNSPNVMFGPGIFVFGCGPYTFASAPTIYGSGRATTTLKLSACTLPVGEASVGVFNVVSKNGGGWRDLSIDFALGIQSSTGVATDFSFLLRYRCASDFVIDNVGLINIGDHSIGVVAQAAGGCIMKNWTVQNSYIQQTSMSPLLVSSGLTMAGITPPNDFENVRIKSNTFVNSKMVVNGKYTHVINNNISGWQFGTGIFQIQDTSKYHLIAGNILHDSGLSIDVNGTPAGGIELNGEYSQFVNNQCYNLGGVCAFVFGSYNLIADNQSENVALGTPQVDNNKGAFVIESSLGVGINPSYNTFANNVDLGGASQLYSYYELNSAPVENVLRNNRFPLPILLESLTTRVVADRTSTVISPETATQQGRISQTTYIPGGASLSVINEISAHPTLGTTAVPVTVMRGLLSQPIVSANFTGTLDAIQSFTSAMTNSSAVTVPAYTGFQAGTLTNGHGITTGTVTNTGFGMGGASAAAGAGGTVINNGFQVVVGQGSSAGTTNRGVYISGNAVASSTSYALHSDSTAPLKIASPLITGAYAIGSLPATVILGAVAGAIAHVTDQTAACPAKGVAPTAGGALICPVFYNGSAWVGL